MQKSIDAASELLTCSRMEPVGPESCSRVAGKIHSCQTMASNLLSEITVFLLDSSEAIPL